jgi:hypothetical protein
MQAIIIIVGLALLTCVSLKIVDTVEKKHNADVEWINKTPVKEIFKL